LPSPVHVRWLLAIVINISPQAAEKVLMGQVTMMMAKMTLMAMAMAMMTTTTA
jgi:hypothetical protein